MKLLGNLPDRQKTMKLFDFPGVVLSETERGNAVGALALICVVFLMIAGFKLLGLVFKAGLFILSIPLLVLGGVAVAAFAIMLLPLTMVGGLLAAIAVPIAVLAPLLPLVLIIMGISLLAKKR
jgi:hypothetical protein